MTLKNVGTTPQAVTSLKLDGADAGQFRLVSGGVNPCASLSPTLTAGQSCTLNLIFAPTSTGDKSANGQDLNVPLTTGKGLGITAFSIPSVSSTLAVPATITTTDDGGITGWYLSENGTTPTATAAGWTSIKPTAFTFAARGPRILYLWVKDSAGNISARSQASTTIDYQLSVSMAGSGGGSVNSSPVGIAITSGSQNATYAPNTPVLLIPLPDTTSSFTRWTGVCTNTTGNCSFTMTGDKTVTATFTAADRARIGATGYPSINAAYSAAVNDAIINLLGAVMTENLTIAKPLTLVGGHNKTFTGRTGDPSVLDGTLTITGGPLVVDGLAVQ